MINQFLSAANVAAIIVSGIAFWFLGFFWYSMLFGSRWKAELEKHGVKINKPAKSGLFAKLAWTLLLNTIIALGISYIVFITSSASVASAISLGIFLGVCFSVTILAVAGSWESRSSILISIDFNFY